MMPHQHVTPIVLADMVTEPPEEGDDSQLMPFRSDENGCGVDECFTRAPCQQKCEDQKIGYRCSCDDGFTLAEDMHTCHGKFGVLWLDFSQKNAR